MILNDTILRHEKGFISFENGLTLNDLLDLNTEPSRDIIYFSFEATPPGIIFLGDEDIQINDIVFETGCQRFVLQGSDFFSTTNYPNIDYERITQVDVEINTIGKITDIGLIEGEFKARLLFNGDELTVSTKDTASDVTTE